MSRIFISYRRVDSPAESGRIYDYLEKTFGQNSIFKDVDAIDFGDDFRNRIQQAVGQCEILLAVIGKTWLQVLQAKTATNQTDWVKFEIETALARSNIRVIPVLLDGVDMPSQQDLPSSLQQLAYLNAARIRHDPDFRSDMARLQKRIESNLSPLAPPQPSADSFLTSGVQKYNAKDFQGAIADYDTAIRLNPNFAIAYFNRGNAKDDLGDSQGAIADFDTAIRLNPNDADAYRNRGAVKVTIGDQKGAIADFDTAIRLNPNYADAYYNRGIAKVTLGDKRGAFADFDTAIRLNPNYAEAYYNRGNTKQELGDRQGAITDYDTALQLNPNDAEAYHNRGLAKRKLGDKQGAIADYLESAKLFQQQGNTAAFNKAMNAVKKLQN